MRRLVASTLFVLACNGVAHAQTQAWEKLVAPGLTYRMEIDLNKPMVIHSLRWTAGSGSIRARVEPARETIVAPADSDKLRGKDTLTNAVRRVQAVAGVNGDFFGATASPLGCMLRDGELLALPFAGRSTFGWGPGQAQVGALAATGTVKFSSGTVPLAGLNREAGDNELVLQSPLAGTSSSKSSASHLVLTASGILRPGVDVVGSVKRVEQGQTSVKLGADEWAVTGSGAQAALLNALRPGDSVTVRFELTGFDFSRIRNVVGGGPALLRDGKPSVDVVAEQFSNAFAMDRHPRTAVGYNRDGDVWMVVVDGRTPFSRGANLSELQDVMLNLGCSEALNLNGGGASTLAVLGLVMNRPSDAGEERPLANALMLFGDLPNASQGDMVIRGTPTVVMGQPGVFTVIDQNGEQIPNGEVLWVAKGSAWIDQSGTLRPVKAGDTTVYASVRGRVLSIRVSVVEAT